MTHNSQQHQLGTYDKQQGFFTSEKRCFEGVWKYSIMCKWSICRSDI